MDIIMMLNKKLGAQHASLMECLEHGSLVIVPEEPESPEERRELVRQLVEAIENILGQTDEDQYVYIEGVTEEDADMVRKSLGVPSGVNIVVTKGK